MSEKALILSQIEICKRVFFVDCHFCWLFDHHSRILGNIDKKTRKQRTLAAGRALSLMIEANSLTMGAASGVDVRTRPNEKWFLKSLERAE